MDERDVIYESPDNGKTITKRKIGQQNKELVTRDKGYSEKHTKQWLRGIGEVGDTMEDAISYVESKYPETTKEFKRLQQEQYRVFCEKQMDYGPGNISVGTNLETDEEVKMSLTGLWFRMNDKIQRMKTLLMSNQNANNEPLEDSFLDVSNYGIMSTIVNNKKWGK
tara:strand:- start:187 stop:684 length:498 start_codon:yes stop_codon:yes gene_type:complete